jgi:hypothetical protein
VTKFDYKVQYQIRSKIDHNLRSFSYQRADVKYSKSHGQVLLDRTGAPDNLLVIVQDYLTQVHNISSNRQVNWKIPEQISMGGGEHQTYPIS